MSGFISTIRWVLVHTSAARGKSAEFDFMLTELRRQLPIAQWYFGDDAKQWLNVDNTASLADRADKVLLLEHPWLMLEARCLERLEQVLHQGYDIAYACDSRNPSPMPAPDYSTLRGCERYVDKVEAVSYALMDSSPDALVQLGTLGGFLKKNPQRVRVSGAYAHDFSGYFGGNRSEVLPLIPANAQYFMDVGGGEGRFLSAIKEMRPTAYTQLVEIDVAAAQLAQYDHCADSVWNGDFRLFASPRKFDCISFLDMLEHVVQPELYLMHAKTLLSNTGIVLASIPNIGHWSVVADLLEGRWDYVPAGIHCITHLRFFTAQSVRDLFDRAGFGIVRIERVIMPTNPQWLAQWRMACQVINLEIDTDSLDTYAFLIVAQPLEKP